MDASGGEQLPSRPTHVIRGGEAPSGRPTSWVSFVRQSGAASSRLLAWRPDGYALALAVVAAWGVLANFARIAYPAVGFDEPFYSIAAWRYVHGDVAPPPTNGLASFDNLEHPPVAKYLFGVAQLLVGHPSVTADRVVAALCTLATAGVLGAWIGRAAGRWIGLAAAALVLTLPMSVPGLPFRFGRYGYLDPVAELFMVAALALSWTWFRRDGRTGWWFAIATGAAIGLASGSKANGFLGTVGPVVLGVALSAREPRVLVRRVLQAGLAAITACAVFFGSYVGLGHPWADIRYMTHFQHVHSVLGHRVLVAGQVYEHPPGWAFLWFAAQGLGLLVSVVCVVCALAAVLLRRDRLVLWCCAGLVGPLVFHMAFAGVILGHYWVMWMPAFLGLVALGGAELVRHRWRRRVPFGVAGVTLGVICICVLLLASLRDTYRMLVLAPPAHRTTSYEVVARGHAPLVYLRLGERSGAEAADESGHGNDGVYGNTPGLGAPGLLTDDPDTAVVFDGTTQYVRVPGTASMDVDSYTVTVWFRATETGQYLASRDSYWGSKVWDLLVDASGHIQFQTFAPFTGAPQAAVSPGVYIDGARHMAVATKSGTEVRLYLDGRLVATEDYPSFVPGTPTLPIDLARRGNGSGQLAGTLDEFAFFESALSEADVAELYDAGSLAAG